MAHNAVRKVRGQLVRRSRGSRGCARTLRRRLARIRSPTCEDIGESERAKPAGYEMAAPCSLTQAIERANISPLDKQGPTDISCFSWKPTRD